MESECRNVGDGGELLSINLQQFPGDNLRRPARRFSTRRDRNEEKDNRDNQQAAHVINQPSFSIIDARENTDRASHRPKLSGLVTRKQFLVAQVTMTEPASEYTRASDQVETEFMESAARGELQRDCMGRKLLLGFGAAVAYLGLTVLVYLTIRRDHSAENWESFLDQRVLETDQTAHDVVAFARPRLPVLTVPSTVSEWEARATHLRSAILDRIVYRGDAAAWRDAECRVEWQSVETGGPGYQLRKLRYEVLPGLWIPAILYVPKVPRERMPVVLSLSGHEQLGMASTHTQVRCINLAKRGMLALNVDWFGTGQLNRPGYKHGRMNQLDLCGASGLAPFYLALRRGIDLLLNHPHADPERVAVTGLSGGGWQTILIGALDPRVTLINPVAGYSSFNSRLEIWSDLGDSEQTPVDLGTIADYTHFTALMAPRPTLLTFNARDRRYHPVPTIPVLLGAARPAYALYGQSDFLRTHINQIPGTHNFERDNREALYQMLAAHFSRDGDEWPPTEIESSNEVLTPEQLEVELPDDNADFNSLAIQVLQKQAPMTSPPESSTERESWQADQRLRLMELVRYRPLAVSATLVRQGVARGYHSRAWRCQVGEWQVPVIEIGNEYSRQSTILFADQDRMSLVQTISSLLAQQHRVLIVDLYGFGECQIPVRDYLFALMINTVGERPLGILAGQLVGIAEWTRSQWGDPVDLITVGPRSGCAGLVAAAIEPKAFRQLRQRDSFDSLTRVLSENLSFEMAPELFCAGLIVTHDLPILRSLIAPGVLREAHDD